LAIYQPSLPDDLKDRLWTAPQSLLAAGGLLRSEGARSTVRLEWAGQHYILKHYAEPTRRHAIKQLVSPSRARTTWKVAHKLADAGVTTPRPVACVENRWSVLRRDSYLMYPYVEGRLLRSYFGDPKEKHHPFIESLWNQLDEMWRRLKELRVSLGDTNLSNFIVSPVGQLWVIDLDKARFHRLDYVAARNQQIRWQQLLRGVRIK
jgi:tRNA A-37 threonylcarbamoyl transferase component Bud32